MTAASPTDLYAGWVAEAKEAAAQLRQRVVEAKHNEELCCDVLKHALEAVMSLELAVCAGRFRVQQRQQLPDIVAAILSNIQLAQTMVQVNGRHWKLSSCTCVPWSQSSRGKLSAVSNSLQNIACRTRELHTASLEETIPYIRASGRSSAQDLPQGPRNSGITPLQQCLGEFSTESVQAMKEALSRFSSDKELTFQPGHQQGQEQLAQSPKATPPRPNFSQQIRASFDRSGLPNYERLPKATHGALDSALVFKSQSVNAAQSNSGQQNSAGVLIRHHTLETNYVPSFFINKDSQGQPLAPTLKLNRPFSVAKPQQMGRGGKLLADLPLSSGPLSAVSESIDATIHHSTTANSARADSIPADIIQQTTLYAASQSPTKALNASTAVQIAQKAASLHRGASLAAKLQRLADSADTRGTKLLKCGSPISAPRPSQRNSSEEDLVNSMPHAAMSRPTQRTSLDKVSKADAEDSGMTTAQRTSSTLDDQAADIRRQRLSSLEQAVKLSSMCLRQADSPSEDSPRSNNTGQKPTHARTFEEPSMQAEHVPRLRRSLSDDRHAPGLRRTLSDAAEQALDAVESMQCSIIPYSQLQIQRKIGDGSIGQVYLARWQETDVAVKVITQMQNLSSVQGIHPQDPVTMEVPHDHQPCMGNLTGTVAQIGLSDIELTAITMFEKEVSIMAAIRHPNVAMLMGLCLSPICVVTEFCARGSLTDVLRKAASDTVLAKQLDWRKRITMALDAAKGMLQLHSHPHSILHRDLKSPNLLVDKHWRVKVTDFNLSSMFKSYTNACNNSSAAAANPRWLAPEVVMHQQHSKAADVYSFGVVLWELMTWQVPWDDCNQFQIMMMLTRDQARPEFPDISTLPGPHWSGIEGFVDLIKACWHQEPDKRPTFESVIASLRTLLIKTHSTRQMSAETPSRGGSDMFPDSPRQLTAEAGVPWASSATTLSPSGSSLARMLGSDPTQDLPPKHARVAGSVRSPFKAAAEKMETEQALSASSASKQDTSLNQSVTAGSVHSPFKAAAKEKESEQNLSARSESRQGTSLNPSVKAGSAHSPFEAAAKQGTEAAAKQGTSEHTAKPVVSPFETALRSRLPQLATESRT